MQQHQTTNISRILASTLTSEQFAAAMDRSAEVLCLACAGSGKSQTLAYRIARLIGDDKVAPESIVAFTFTDKAAESIKLRVAKALDAVRMPPEVIGAMYIGTIHSFCQRVLGDMDAKYRQFEVLDENRFKLFLVSRYAQLGIATLRSSNKRYFEAIKRVAEAWTVVNDQMLTLTDVSKYASDLGKTLETLQTLLDNSQYIDFSLMIRLVVDALQKRDRGAENAISQIKHLMVDEYQDVNPSEEALIRELRKRCDTLFVVGDDDQAIYSFKGADVSNIISFQDRYPRASSHTLALNFRSTEAIVKTADSFAAAELGANRIVKNPRANPYAGVRDLRYIWFDDRVDEAKWVADRIQALLGMAYQEKDGSIRGLTPADFAILMRSTASQEGDDGPPRHAVFTDALNQNHIVYTLEAGGSIFDRPQVSVLREVFESFRNDNPNRNVATAIFNNHVISAYPKADLNEFYKVLSEWGKKIHAPPGGTRQRLRPQQIVHELLQAFRIAESSFDDGIMQDIGVFSRIMQDVEAVYVSVDSTSRFKDILNFLQNVAETGYDSSTIDVLSRPDAVTISTVHKMKGLEFPVVFVVDVEAQRFPGNKRRYEGWLPLQIMQSALNHGSYTSTDEGEARLFYTALTRAERYLYVTGSAKLPNAKIVRKPSRFALELKHSELQTDYSVLPAGLIHAPPKRRIDDNIMPTSFSDIRYYLRCPKNYQFRSIYGFSPPVPELFGFGKTVHTSINKLHARFARRAPSLLEAEAVADATFHLKHVNPSGDPQNHPGAYERAKASAKRVVGTYAQNYSTDFARRKEVEWSFEVAVAQGVISGAIDLMLRDDGRGHILDANVIDFKAMKGPDPDEEQEEFHWTELALQVQLYALAARKVMNETAYNGAVHFLKDNQRILVPVQDDAVQAAIENVEWAIDRIIDQDFPMRPHQAKCEVCDFKLLCLKNAERFKVAQVPPSIHIPDAPSGVRMEMARAFSQFEDNPSP